MNLYEWAQRWGIPFDAIQEYRRLVGVEIPAGTAAVGSEAGATKQVRLEAAEQDIMLWRNNVGVARDQSDRVIRYGLANDSAGMNRNVKSSDLIGLRPTGQFVAREVKAPGWHYSGNDHEKAQLRFLELVLAHGGDAAFATGEGTL